MLCFSQTCWSANVQGRSIITRWLGRCSSRHTESRDKVAETTFNPEDASLQSPLRASQHSWHLAEPTSLACRRGVAPASNRCSLLACLTSLCVCCSGAASKGAGPGGVLICACRTCGVACADGVLSCPAGAGLDSARSNLGQVDTGAVSKGHSAAGRAGQSRVKQEHVSQPAPDSSDAGSMELPSPAKQEADAKPDPEVRTQSLTLKTLLEFRDTSSMDGQLGAAFLQDSEGCGRLCQASLQL